jgi:hypothetical protein
MSIALDDEKITLPALLRGRTADTNPKQLQLPAVFQRELLISGQSLNSHNILGHSTRARKRVDT